MVNAETKVGPKGQIVIPKLLRDEFGILPGDEVMIKETSEGMLIERVVESPIKILRLIAKSGKRAKKINFHKYEEQIEERWKRAKK